jgi:tetratricopeptide (TPR) repeat protein
MNTNAPLDDSTITPVVLESDSAFESELKLKPEPIVKSKIEVTADKGRSMRSFLSRMGLAWFEQGEFRQAIEVCIKIIDTYPNSAESQTAQDTLLTIAQRYEQEGQLRLSLDVLERLELALE